MKINITYKFPDAIDYALSDLDDVTPEELSDLEDELKGILGSSEYITVEVDTETREVKFVPRR
jgi:hypothetical protein